MSEPVMPMIDDIALDYVVFIRQRTFQRAPSVPVAGLSGDVIQVMGRASHEIEIGGLIVGEDAVGRLESLQQAAAEGIERTFTADITSALELEQVVIISAEFVQVAGRPDNFEYRLLLRESPPLPPPAEVSSFGGLDGLDTGFDTDIMGDIADMASDLQNAIDTASDIIGQLDALASLSDLGLDNPLTPLSDATGRIGTAAEGIAGVAGGLSDLLGGGD